MGMQVSDAASAGGHVAGGENSRQAADGGRGFFEVFRKLPEANLRKSNTGLQVGTLKAGSGTAAAAGMKVRVQYTGWLEDGTKFDSSLDRGKPFELTLGAGRVIKGWEEGLAGIKPGERRQLVIPAALGYGNRQMGNIPPGATLVFNVEAIAVEPLPVNGKGTLSMMA